MRKSAIPPPKEKPRRAGCSAQAGFSNVLSLPAGPSENISLAADLQPEARP